MYTGAGRKGAQSAIMVITDGKPSFQFQTNELVQQLDDKNVQRYFLVVNENGGDDLKKMQKWASAPWETNLIHVPGLDALSADATVWALENGGDDLKKMQKWASAPWETN